MSKGGRAPQFPPSSALTYVWMNCGASTFERTAQMWESLGKMTWSVSSHLHMDESCRVDFKSRCGYMG